eukprot:TRINITY_DN4633_c0_g2_i3.p1 TRINITY_DN4633_c0_g2~~TRINITY_DN4633_c0_g2_i3.p1  ORF type:complete len:109 (+),score=23.66 TRINITY_DN4633_c0_g2_i3:136-462(+)
MKFTESDEENEREDSEEFTNSSEEERRGKEGFWAKKKRGIASSGLGKVVIEQMLDNESKTLIHILCEMVEEFYDRKMAKTVKKHIFKVISKTFTLHSVCSCFFFFTYM